MSRRRILRLPIVLTPKQLEVDGHPARFKLMKWARRVGKTWFQAYTVVKWSLRQRGKYWYVTKTLSLGREEFWPALLNLLPRDYIAKTDERLLSVKLTNGSVICIKSGEKEDNLRGRGLNGVVVDEAAFLKERLWDQILRPQLGHSRGPALIASSPRKGWFTRLYNEVAKGKDQDWFASHATIYDSTLDAKEIEVIKAKASNQTWRQEYMAEELSNVGQVYDEFGSANIYNPASKFLDIHDYPRVVGIDWGLADPTGIAWVAVSREGHIVVPTTHIQAGWDVPRHAAMARTKSAGLQVQAHILDCSAFRKEPTSMTSIANLFAKEGLPCQPSEKNLPASIDIVRRFIRGDGITPWLYISSDCPATISGFQEWEHDAHEPDILAAVRYAVVYAVRRRLTKLADNIPAPISDADPLRHADEDILLAARARLMKTGGARWNWDYGAGVPA